MPQCRQKLEAENARLPKHLRRKIPDAPPEIKPGQTQSDAAFETFNQNLAECERCGRTFLPDRLEVHLRSCKGPSQRTPRAGAALGAAARGSPSAALSPAAGSPAGASTTTPQGKRPGSSGAGLRMPALSPNGSPVTGSEAAARGSSVGGARGGGGGGNGDEDDADGPIPPKASYAVPETGGDGDAGDLVPCGICGRRFAEDRVAKHEAACAKASAKPKKVFDGTKIRTAGDPEMAKFAKQAAKNEAKAKAAPAPGKRDWRVEHENFVAAMRAARAAAKDPLNAPPPPPSIPDPSFIQCPHCSRRFNATAAERHIPACAVTLNKPKPPPSRAGGVRPAAPTAAPPAASAAPSPRPKTGGAAGPQRPKTGGTMGGAGAAAAAGMGPGSGTGVIPTGTGAMGRTSASTTTTPRVAPAAASQPAPSSRPGPVQRQASTGVAGAGSSGGTPSGKKFCEECGTKYETQTAKFCAECGSKR
jgi:hypothetical protein